MSDTRPAANLELPARPNGNALNGSASRRGLVGLMLCAALGRADAGLFSALRGRGDKPAANDDDNGVANAGEASGRFKGEVTLPPGARVERDLAYGSDPQQKLDAYIPADANKAPIVLMVHGGAWMLGDKSNKGVAPNKVARWLPRGYIVVSTNYRMDRAAPNPLQQADDVARAMAFVQKTAPSWGGDPARLLLMGHSSGAHLVSLLAADPRVAERQGALPWLGTVPLDSAAFDIVEIMERKHYGFYDRVFGSDRNAWVENSPILRLNGKPSPMLLVCSSRRSDSCPPAERFAAKATAAGARVTVLPVDFNHGEVNAELGKGGDYTAKVEAFMKSLGLP